MSGPFFVLLSRPDQLQLDRVSQALAAFHRAPLLDARRLANHAWGFLGERMEETPARLLVTEATKAGLGTLLLQESELAPAAEPAAVRSARCEEDVFLYTTGSDPSEKRLSWKDVRLVAAAGLNADVAVKKTVAEGPSQAQKAASLGITLMTGLPVNIGGKEKKVQKTVRQTDLLLFMDVFGQEAGKEPVRLHIDADGFNFASLGGRKRPEALGNFRLLLEEVSGRAAGALRNRGARVFLASQPLHTAGYLSLDDYERECRWLLTLSRPPAA